MKRDPEILTHTFARTSRHGSTKPNPLSLEAVHVRGGWCRRGSGWLWFAHTALPFVA